MQAFRYTAERSYLHSLNPSVKLLVVVAVTVAITFVFDVATPLAFLVLSTICTILLGRISTRYVVRSLAPFTLLALGFILTYSLFHRDLGATTPLFSIGPLVVSWEGVELGLSVGLRILFLASTSLLFVATTDPGDFVLSLVQQARLNYKLAFALLAASRFTPIHAHEYANIRAAGNVRGLGARSGFVENVKAIRRDAVPLLAGAIRRSERLAVAMDSRAFGAYPTRTYHKHLRVTGRDWVFLAGSIAVSVALFATLAYLGLVHGIGVQYQ
jgi:energy-coupling factor transport system permease protein